MHTLQLDLLAEGLSLMLKAGAYVNQWLSWPFLPGILPSVSLSTVQCRPAQALRCSYLL